MNIGLYHIRDSSFVAHYNPQIIDTKLNKKAYSVEVLIWNNNFQFSVKTLKKFPKLKLLINWGHEDANLLDEASLKKLIRIKKVNSWSEQSVSEYILMQLLNFERTEATTPKQLYQKEIGFIGFGKIAFQLASTLRNSFQCTVRYNATSNHSIPGFTHSSKAELFQTCDYVIVLVNSKECRIDPKLLKTAKSELVLVNFSRDVVIPFKKVLPFLKSKRIRGFIGDVVQMSSSYRPPSNTILLHKKASRTKEAKQLKEQTTLFFLKRFELMQSSKKSFIYLARHGKSRANTAKVFETDTALSDVGIQQAQEIGNIMKKIRISKIFSSPLRRAQETSRNIEKITGIPVTTVPAFTELNFGLFKGVKRKKVEELFPNFFSLRNKNPSCKLYIPYPFGESYYQLYLRVLPVLIEILVHNENFIIVGHESLNRVIRGIILGRSLKNMMKYRQRNNQLIRIEMMENKEEILTFSE